MSWNRDNVILGQSGELAVIEEEFKPKKYVFEYSALAKDPTVFGGAKLYLGDLQCTTTDLTVYQPFLHKPEVKATRKDPPYEWRYGLYRGFYFLLNKRDLDQYELVELATKVPVWLYVVTPKRIVRTPLFAEEPTVLGLGRGSDGQEVRAISWDRFETVQEFEIDNIFDLYLPSGEELAIQLGMIPRLEEAA